MCMKYRMCWQIMFSDKSVYEFKEFIKDEQNEHIFCKRISLLA
jgi:hypothetical protein